MKILSVMMACLLACATGPAVAAFKMQTLSAMQMEAWRVRMSFHQLAVRGNAPQDLDTLEKVLHQGDELLDKLGAQAVTSAERDTVAQLHSQWQALGQRARNNPLASLGYADFNAFTAINRQTLEMERLLQHNMTAAASGTDDALMRLGVRLLKLSSEYLALATFPSAGINTGTQEAPMAFSEQAMALEQQLQALEEGGGSSDQAVRMLTTLKTRWAFIKGAIPKLDDPNAARVPLLFYRYSSQTADDLLALQKS